jgi:hypothetical protein
MAEKRGGELGDPQMKLEKTEIQQLNKQLLEQNLPANTIV